MPDADAALADDAALDKQAQGIVDSGLADLFVFPVELLQDFVGRKVLGLAQQKMGNFDPLGGRIDPLLFQDLSDLSLVFLQQNLILVHYLQHH